MRLSDTRQVSADDFIELGRRIGLPEKLVMQEIKRFTRPNEEADALIERSFLSEDLKRSYQSSYHYRRAHDSVQMNLSAKRVITHDPAENEPKHY